MLYAYKAGISYKTPALSWDSAYRTSWTTIRQQTRRLKCNIWWRRVFNVWRHQWWGTLVWGTSRRHISSNSCFIYGTVWTEAYATYRIPPLSYFSLFFTASLFALITKETNRYVEQFLSQNDITDNSRVTEWLPVTELEMKVFIACILNMGLIRKPTIFSYWSTTCCNLTPWFSQMFPRNRFQVPSVGVTLALLVQLWPNKGKRLFYVLVL